MARVKGLRHPYPYRPTMGGKEGQTGHAGGWPRCNSCGKRAAEVDYCDVLDQGRICLPCHRQLHDDFGVYRCRMVDHGLRVDIREVSQ